MVNVCDHLHCQLQAGGQPSSPSPSNEDSPRDIHDILAWFDDDPMCDVHDELFIQDGGDDNGYYE